MKKLLMIIFATIVTMTSMSDNVFAQWTTSLVKKDELRGTPNFYANRFEARNGDSFVCFSNKEEVTIAAHRGIFDYGVSYRLITVQIGFYKGDKLIKKTNANFYVPQRDASHAFSEKAIGKKIINHLKTTGSVRLIARKHSGPDFDITIPMNAEIK